jgi:hypothetical protein
VGKRDLWALKGNEGFMILPAHNGSVTLIFDTVDYKQKAAELLKDHTYRKLKKDPEGQMTWVDRSSVPIW